MCGLWMERDCGRLRNERAPNGLAVDQDCTAISQKPGCPVELAPQTADICLFRLRDVDHHALTCPGHEDAISVNKVHSTTKVVRLEQSPLFVVESSAYPLHAVPSKVFSPT